MRTAYQLLSSARVNVVLSNMHLSDGTGFGLLVSLAGLLLLAARRRWWKRMLGIVSSATFGVFERTRRNGRCLAAAPCVN